MDQIKIDRINELAHIAKTRTLTPEEQSEREKLRREYIEDWKRGALATLENTYIMRPDGTKEKLSRKK